MSKKTAVVLAAGKGTRMESELPKVLIDINGRPMIEFVLDALAAGGIDRVIVVVGYRADLVKQRLAGRPRIEFVEQTEQLGTGHAVMVCREALADANGPVLIVTGDSPLLQADSVRNLLSEYEQQSPACIIGTTHKENPFGLGRIVRDAAGEFVGIIEQKDATAEQAAITEVNMSTYVFRASALLAALGQLTTNNAQREYYITDCPGILKRQGERVVALPVLKACEALSVNTVEELAVVAVEMQRLAAK
jgi:bifunctional UDP-N-acetylglucosamine pyrophosphorylase/glucosamine-1-phosphate N-acetyltransferase/UDP-N-acetylglucosamine pyrophosphorylase